MTSSSVLQQSYYQTIARYAFGFLLVFYAASIFVWQHNHLKAHHYSDHNDTLLKSKEAFYRTNKQQQQHHSSSRPIHHTVSHILNKQHLPIWVKEYVKFHNEQRTKYITAKRANITSTDVKFLISRCLTNDKCGGASDRLQDMPYNMMLANRTNRVLLVKWEKPSMLEHYLMPPSHDNHDTDNANDAIIDNEYDEYRGIDWTIQDELYEYLKSEGNWNLKGNEEDDRLKIVSTIRRDSAAPKFRKYENDIVGHKIYHDIFRLMFSPSKALTQHVESTMKSLQLIPQQYSSVHLRVKYPVENINEKTFTFQNHRDKIIHWATNAVNCAAELHPNSTIYVSSDNNDTIGYLLEESHFAQHYIDATKHKKHPLVIKLVARDYSKEVEHVAFSTNTEADSFMDVFIDLMILGLGKCVAHGVGGYGRLGAALSGGECVMAHRTHRGKPNLCSDVLGKIKV